MSDTHFFDFIEGMPKAELHLHIEGSFEPELMFKIAQRNQASIPYKNVEEVKKAYKFTCLQDFLDIYYAGAGVLQNEIDFYELTMAYLQKCHEEHITHAEIMFDPQTHTHRDIPFDTVIKGIQKAREEAKSRWGISTELIMSYLRHLTEEDAFVTLKESLPYKSLIKAIGLDSSEKDNPPAKFTKVFEASCKEGYVPLAHAGEEGSAAYIWEALDVLKIKRVDHGNNCLEDQLLMKRLADEKIALTICPLSNTALKVVDEMGNHPLKRLMDAGIVVTVNSDDPAYFGGYLNANYKAVQKALKLSRNDLITLAENSFQYSLLSDDLKATKITELHNWVKNHTF
ncbi:adenosine deaminase [Ascidiimonas sp. W6]|uniref:adenosine deaminase n=1 Tax=Ascidiimonas meishanensis TaxID=3128903 RepID=UPI0030EDB1AB